MRDPKIAEEFDDQKSIPTYEFIENNSKISKKIEEKEFNKLWRVMTKDQYDLQFKASLQNRQMGKMKYEWWKDEPTGPDDGFDY